jgi:two-component system, sensor histidine kinase PdtaS
MKRFLLISIVLIFFQQQASSQRYKERIDSMLTLFSKASEDSNKVNLLVNILGIYSYYDPRTGLTYNDRALTLAEKAGSKTGIGRIKDRIGRLYWATGKFDNAIKYHLEALDIYNETGNTYARNYVLIELGQDYLNATKFDEAGHYLLKALKLSEETGDKSDMARAYNILTALYENQGNYVEASKAAYANLKVCEEMGDKKGMAYATTSVASNFQLRGNNAEALKHYKQSLQLGIEAGDQLVQTYAYSSMGDIYLGTGNLTEAEKKYKEGLNVAGKMENAWLVYPILYRGIGNVYREQARYAEALRYYLLTADDFRAGASNHSLASLYSEIAIVHIRLANYDLARKYLDSSMALCKKLDTKVPLKDYYNGRQLLDSATGNWKEAYYHYKEYTAIKDSTFNKENLQKMVMSEMQYEADKKDAIAKIEQEKKDVRAQEDLKRQRNIRNLAIVGLAIVLIFSIVAYRQRNKLAKEKKRSDQLLTDKELLLREIHHRVKNNLEVVSSLLALQSDQINDPNTKEAMLEGQNRVHSIGIVHQKLYQGENLGTIEMKDYFVNLSESVLDSFGAEGRVNIEFAMEKLNVDIDTAVPLGLIVNELLTNTLKYAFPDKQSGSIRIKLEKQTGDILHLEVSDNGIGKSGITQGTGFGGQLISLLTRQLNGSMKEETKNGTRVLFDFKLEKVA